MSNLALRWLSVAFVSSPLVWSCASVAQPVTCKGEVAKEQVHLLCYDSLGRLASKIIGSGKRPRSVSRDVSAVAVKIIGNGEHEGLDSADNRVVGK